MPSAARVAARSRLVTTSRAPAERGHRQLSEVRPEQTLRRDCHAPAIERPRQPGTPESDTEWSNPATGRYRRTPGRPGCPVRPIGAHGRQGLAGPHDAPRPTGLSRAEKPLIPPRAPDEEQAFEPVRVARRPDVARGQSEIRGARADGVDEIREERVRIDPDADARGRRRVGHTMTRTPGMRRMTSTRNQEITNVTAIVATTATGTNVAEAYSPRFDRPARTIGWIR